MDKVLSAIDGMCKGGFRNGQLVIFFAGKTVKTMYGNGN